jgi:hypothetical protein
MQRYDREREARSFRGGRDNESRGYDPRGTIRNDERWQTQGPQNAWRDDDGPGMSYADQGDWRDSYTGYDEDERYRSDFAQQRYGRGQNVGFGQDYDDRRGGPRGSYASRRDYGSASGQYGSSNYEGGRPLYGENSRAGWSNESVRQGYSSPRTPYSNLPRSASRNYGYGPQPDYGRDLGPSYARNEMQGRYGGQWRDYDDSGQGYVGGYGSDLGYGASRGRDSGGLYGDFNSLAPPRGAYDSDDRYAQGANYGTGRESSYGRGYDELSGQSHRGRGPKNYMRSDERIKEDLSERLSDDPLIDAADINVEVKNGIVTLTGSVDARHLKHRAEDLADHCSGVKDVENKLTIRKPGTGQNLAGSPGGGSTSAGRSDESGKKH